MRKLALAKVVCIGAVFCVAAAVASSAQTFTTVASFDGTDGSEVAYGPLVQGANGALWRGDDGRSVKQLSDSLWLRNNFLDDTCGQVERSI
jgi:hypothetical protein